MVDSLPDKIHYRVRCGPAGNVRVSARDLDENVLYHSLPGLASCESCLLSEIGHIQLPLSAATKAFMGSNSGRSSGSSSKSREGGELYIIDLSGISRGVLQKPGMIKGDKWMPFLKP